MSTPDMSGEDPTMVTAADYETHIRPHIASLEAEIERLRDAAELARIELDTALGLWSRVPHDARLCVERARRTLDITALPSVRDKTFCPLCGKPAVIVGREKDRGTTLIHCDDCMAPLS